MKKNNAVIVRFLLIAIFLIILPVIVKQQYIIHMIIAASIMAILTVSWNLLSGYMGVFSFGHPAFYGIGAYTSALLSIHAGLSPWITMFVGAVVASLFSVIVAFPTLRLRGAYVAVVTLAFMSILDKVCYNWTSLTNGPMGLFGIPPLTNFEIFGLSIRFDGISRVPHYYVIMTMLAITLFVTHRIVNSALGLHLMAIRESEEAASAMGVRIHRYKILMFMITSFFAGLAGAFYAHYILVLTPGIFAFFLMATILASTLIGGWGSFYGPVLGAYILGFLSDYLKEIGDLNHFVYGAFLIVVIIFMPKGLIKGLQKSFSIKKGAQNHEPSIYRKLHKTLFRINGTE